MVLVIDDVKDFPFPLPCIAPFSPNSLVALFRANTINFPIELPSSALVGVSLDYSWINEQSPLGNLDEVLDAIVKSCNDFYGSMKNKDYPVPTTLIFVHSEKTLKDRYERVVKSIESALGDKLKTDPDLRKKFEELRSISLSVPSDRERAMLGIHLSPLFELTEVLFPGALISDCLRNTIAVERPVCYALVIESYAVELNADDPRASAIMAGRMKVSEQMDKKELLTILAKYGDGPEILSCWIVERKSDGTRVLKPYHKKMANLGGTFANLYKRRYDA